MNKICWLILGFTLAMTATSMSRAQSGANTDARAQDLVNLARNAVGGAEKLDQVKGISLTGKIHHQGDNETQPNDMKLQLFFHTANINDIDIETTDGKSLE